MDKEGSVEYATTGLRSSLILEKKEKKGRRKGGKEGRRKEGRKMFNH